MNDTQKWTLIGGVLGLIAVGFFVSLELAAKWHAENLAASTAATQAIIDNAIDARQQQEDDLKRDRYIACLNQRNSSNNRYIRCDNPIPGR
jgi:hypothetical protein